MMRRDQKKVKGCLIRCCIHVLVRDVITKLRRMRIPDLRKTLKKIRQKALEAKAGKCPSNTQS